MTYEPAGAPIDPARGEAIVAGAEGTPRTATPGVAEPSPFSQVARPVETKGGVPAPIKAAAVGGATVVAGLALAALLPRRRNRVIVVPGRKRGKRKLKATKTTSVLVDLHLLEER